jgi:hypothetical protein
MQEPELYPSVKEFVFKTFKCAFPPFQEAGKQGIGFVDVFGVRYKNPEKSKIETIGVEVKKKLASPCTDFGQAKGYSVFCHRMYFASIDEFDKDDMEIARHLSIGLIEIKRGNPNFECKEVLEAPANVTIGWLREYVLKAKGIFTCQSCKVTDFYERGDYTAPLCNLDEIPTYSNVTYVKNQIKSGKGLLTKDGDFYCNKCAREKLKIG